MSQVPVISKMPNRKDGVRKTCVIFVWGMGGGVGGRKGWGVDIDLLVASKRSQSRNIPANREGRASSRPSLL